MAKGEKSIYKENNYVLEGKRRPRMKLLDGEALQIVGTIDDDIVFDLITSVFNKPLIKCRLRAGLSEDFYHTNLNSLQSYVPENPYAQMRNRN